MCLVLWLPRWVTGPIFLRNYSTCTEDHYREHRLRWSLSILFHVYLSITILFSPLLSSSCSIIVLTFVRVLWETAGRSNDEKLTVIENSTLAFVPSSTRLLVSQSAVQFFQRWCHVRCRAGRYSTFLSNIVKVWDTSLRTVKNGFRNQSYHDLASKIEISYSQRSLLECAVRVYLCCAVFKVQ